MQELARAEAARPPRTAKSGQVYELSALDQTPVARFQARPQYPFEMRRAGVNGEVVVDFLVDTNGEVQDAYALRSSQKEFEAAAVQAVSKWRFKPGRKGGRDVPTHMQVPIVFTLEGQSKPRPPTQPSTGPGPTVERAEPSATVNLATFDVVGTSGAASQPAEPRD
jgi:TonB family protein